MTCDQWYLHTISSPATGTSISISGKVPTHLTTPPPLSSTPLIRIMSPSSKCCEGDFGLEEVDEAVVVVVVGDAVTVLLAVTTVLSFTTTEGSGDEELTVGAADASP